MDAHDDTDAHNKQVDQEIVEQLSDLSDQELMELKILLEAEIARRQAAR